jgi:hypothetical protein
MKPLASTLSFLPATASIPPVIPLLFLPVRAEGAVPAVLVPAGGRDSARLQDTRQVGGSDHQRGQGVVISKT